MNQTSGVPSKANLLTPLVVKESAVVIAGHRASPGKLVRKHCLRPDEGGAWQGV